MFNIRSYFDDGEVETNNGAVCFAYWGKEIHTKVDADYRPISRRQLLRCEYLAPVTSEFLKFSDILLKPQEERGLGLGEFFTEEDISKVADGVVGLDACKFNSYYQKLAILTPFRYAQEFPELVSKFLHLYDLEGDAIDAFFAAHFFHVDWCMSNHTVVGCGISTTYRDYLTRIRDVSIFSATAMWCGKGEYQQSISLPEAKIAVYPGNKYLQWITEI